MQTWSMSTHTHCSTTIYKLTRCLLICPFDTMWILISNAISSGFGMSSHTHKMSINTHTSKVASPRSQLEGDFIVMPCPQNGWHFCTSLCDLLAKTRIGSWATVLSSRQKLAARNPLAPTRQDDMKSGVNEPTVLMIV